MLRKGTNYLLGQVELRVEASYPERLLNLCAMEGIVLWDVKWQEERVFTCCLSRRACRRLRRRSEELDCTITVLRSKGVPDLMDRARRRRYLLGGFCVCLGLLLFGSLFVWDFSIEGTTTVPEEEILRALERHGVTLGTFGLSVDSEDLRNHVLLEIPELSWIAVNVSGYQAHIQVRARIKKPEIAEKKGVYNLVATRAGLVVRTRVLEGDRQVMPGMTVEEGQILASGVMDLETTGARLLASMGQVWARTWHELTVKMPLTIQQKHYTGEVETRHSLVLGQNRIKFYGNGSIDATFYDKISQRARPTLPGGLRLPVALVRESYRHYEPVAVQRDPAAAELAAKTLLTAYLSTLIGEEGTISSVLCSSREVDGVVVVTLRAECVEQIARRVALSAESK